MPRRSAVSTEILKNVTLSADGRLIEQARLRAVKENRTLNAAFREWLGRYAGVEGGGHDYDALMRQLSHIQSKPRFSRDELNER
jgi:hypothetical protein